MFFYLGQYHLLRGARDTAVQAFERAVEIGAPGYTEYRAAKRELQRLAPRRVSDVPGGLRQ